MGMVAKEGHGRRRMRSEHQQSQSIYGGCRTVTRLYDTIRQS